MAGPDVPVGQGLAALFQPRSIAIVGASDDVTKIGGRPVQFLQKYGFAGAIYPINRKGGTVQFRSTTVDGAPLIFELPGASKQPADIGDKLRLGFPKRDIYLFREPGAR